ncbi:GntR family transcriptional regulator [Virgibacillus sp. NKC19-16]|nr:GntR family transcriptional regulator [Virgibacillus sp. NKC19-16]
MIPITVNKETQIIDDMMQEIQVKNIEPEDKLPSENELAEMYHVPRMTVRNALIKLEEQGVIYSKQGKGRYLKEKSQKVQLHLTGKTSFTDKMNEAGHSLITRNVSCEKIKYDEKIYHILHADESDAVYKIARLRIINDEPIAIHNSYVCEANFPEIAEDGRKIESMFAYYRGLGYTDFSSSKTLLSVTFPTFNEQQLLSSNRLVPLLVIESDCMDTKSGNVLEHTKIVYRSDKFKYDITID